MTFAVTYLPQARDDIDDAYRYYEQQRPGVGARFVSALQSQVSVIQKNPGSYGAVYQEVRAAVLRHFPYVVYYRIEASRVVVIAVQHGSRDWRHWQSRA